MAPTNPVIQSATIPIGMFTQLSQGGAPLDDLVLPSTTIDHYLVTETDGNASNGYWRTTANALDGNFSPTYQTFTSNAQHTVSNTTLLTTALYYVANHGTNYSSADIGNGQGSGTGGATIQTCSSVSVVDLTGWASFMTPLHAGQVLLLRSAGTAYVTNTTLAAFTSTNPCTGLQQTGQGGTGIYVLTQNNGTISTPQETQVGDLICGSDGSAIFVFGAETDNNHNETPGVLYQFKIFVQGTAVPYSIGNVTPAGGTCGAYTQSTVGTGGSITAQYYGYAEAPTPSSAGTAANLGYANTSAGCGAPPASALCGDNLAAYTFSVVGCADSGCTHPSNTATLTIDLAVDAANIGNNIIGAPNGQTLYSGPGSTVVGGGGTSGMVAMRSAAKNCTTGGSSVCDLELLTSVGAPMSQTNQGPTQGDAKQTPFFGFSYLEALASAGATWSINDSLTFEPACRHGGAALYTANADSGSTTPVPNSPLTACQSKYGGVPTALDIITMGSQNSNPCDTASPSTPGMGGMSIAGFSWVNPAGTNYIVDNETGLDMAAGCDIYLVGNTAKMSHTVTNGLLTQAGSGNFWALLTMGTQVSNMYGTYTYCAWVASCYIDGTDSANSSVGTNVRFKHTVNQGFTNSGARYCQIGIYTDLEYHLQPMFYPLTVIHPDGSQWNAGCYPVNGQADRYLSLQAGGNASIPGDPYFGNVNTVGVDPSLWGKYIQGFRCNDCAVTINNGTGFYFGANDSGTGRQSTFANYLILRQQSPVPGSNAANPYISITGMSRTIVAGDKMKIGLQCQQGIGTCVSGNYFAAQSYYVFTAVTGTPSLPASQFQVDPGGNDAITLQNLINAMGQAITPGTCAGVTSPSKSAVIAASLAASGPGGFFCARPVPQGSSSLGASTEIYTSIQAGSPFWIFPICTSDSTGSNDCGASGSTNSWATQQFVYSEDDSTANLPTQWADQQIITHGPNLSLFNSTIGNATSNCAPAVNFTASVNGSGLMTVTGAPSSGSIVTGMNVYVGASLLGNVSSLGSGSGGTGTYNLSGSSTHGSATMVGYLYWCGVTKFTGGLIQSGVDTGSGVYFTQALASANAGPAISLDTSNVVIGCDASNNQLTINSGTLSGGVVTLTMSAGVSFSPGETLMVFSLTGTGAFNALTGQFVDVSASGTTVTYNAPAGTAASTITGGKLTHCKLGGYFSGDGNGVEYTFESEPESWYFDPSRSAYDLVHLYQSNFVPQSGGPLDPSGTVTGGIEDAFGDWLSFTGIGAGSTKPGDDMQTTGDPWLH